MFGKRKLKHQNTEEIKLKILLALLDLDGTCSGYRIASYLDISPQRCNYNLSALVKEGIVVHTDEGYRLQMCFYDEDAINILYVFFTDYITEIFKSTQGLKVNQILNILVNMIRVFLHDIEKDFAQK